MGVFNSPYVYKPINKMASTSLQAGTRSNISSEQLKVIQKRQAAATRTQLDDVFEQKCAEVSERRKEDNRRLKQAANKSQAKKKGKRGIFGKLHW